MSLISGIKVSNTPGAVVASTADVGIFLLIGAIRNFNHGLMQLRRGNWKNGVARGHDPEGKVMGVLGMGDIGQVCLTQKLTIGNGSESDNAWHENPVLQP